MTDRSPSPNKAPGAKVAIICAAVVIAAPLAAQFEGYAPKVYKDPVGIPTYCYGETELAKLDPTKIYSKTECMALLRQRMARDYAPRIAACLPQIVDNRRVNVFAALLDASYNAGAAAVCKSRMAVAVRADDWNGACRGFSGWYTTARDRRTGVRVQFKGLQRRRIAEMNLCLKPASLPAPAPLVFADYQQCVTVNPGPLRPPSKPVLHPNNSELA